MRARHDIRLGGVVGALAVVVCVIVVAAAPLTGAPRGEVVSPAAAPRTGLHLVVGHQWRVHGRVDATLLVGDTVYVGGHFDRVVGPGGETLARRNVVAFGLGSGTPRRHWRADTDGTVHTLVARKGRLYLGGRFHQVDHRRRPHLAAVSLATGDLARGFDPVVDAPVHAVAVSGRSLYLGGFFNEVGGVAALSLAKVDAGTGAPVRGFSAAVDGGVYGLAVDRRRSILYAGGAFSHVDGRPRWGVAALDAHTGQVVGHPFAGSAGPAFALTLGPGGDRLVAGEGGGANAAVAWQARTGRRVWRREADGDVQAVCYRRGRIYFGFHEGFGKDHRVKVLAARLSDGRLVRGFRPRIPAYWGVTAISAGRRAVVIGGAFGLVHGHRVGHWARFLTR